MFSKFFQKANKVGSIGNANRSFIFGDPNFDLNQIVSKVKSGLFCNQSNLKFAYNYLHPVNKAVNAISSQICNTDLFLKKMQSGEDGVVEKHELIDLLEEPNSFALQTKTALLNEIIKNYILFGEVFLFITKYKAKITELQVLENGLLQYEIDSFTNKVSKYTLSTSTSAYMTFKSQFEMLDGVGREVFKYKSFEGDETEYYILHFKGNSNDLQGRSHLGAIWLQIQQYLLILLYRNNALNSKMHLKTILFPKHDGRDTREISQQTLDDLKALFSQSKSTGDQDYNVSDRSTSVIDIPLDKIDMASHNMQDDGYANIVKKLEEDIYTNLGIPLAMMSADSKYNNKELDIIRFYEETVFPLMQSILHFFNKSLLPHYKNGRQMYLSFDKMSFLPYKQSLTEINVNLVKSNVLTINEARQTLGRAPIVGGDTIYTSGNSRPIGVNTDLDDLEDNQF